MRKGVMSMQPVIIGIIAVGVVALLALFSGAFGQLVGGETAIQAPAQLRQDISPTETQSTQRTPATLNKIKLEIGKVFTWDGDVADIPLTFTGQPLEIEFVIKFPRNLVRVSQVESSANWKTWIERSNERGEIFIRAEPITITPGSHQLLTLRFYRLERANAMLTIPRETIKARFSSGSEYEVEVISGSIGPVTIRRMK